MWTILKSDKQKREAFHIMSATHPQNTLFPTYYQSDRAGGSCEPHSKTACQLPEEMQGRMTMRLAVDLREGCRPNNPQWKCLPENYSSILEYQLLG